MPLSKNSNQEGRPFVIVPLYITNNITEIYNSLRNVIKALNNSNLIFLKNNIVVNNSTNIIVRKKENIFFDFDTKEWHNIKQDDIDRWAETYPACDILAELRRMREWLLANPKRKKKNYQKFIINWLTSQQDKGGTKARSSGLEDWVNK